MNKYDKIKCAVNVGLVMLIGIVGTVMLFISKNGEAQALGV